MEENFEDFEFNNDPVEEQRLQEFVNQLIEISIRSAYETIDQMGMETWIDEIPLSRQRKLKIMNRMIQFFELVEEFEKCAFLLKGVRQLEPNDLHQPDVNK